jgi:hypothetical protein
MESINNQPNYSDNLNRVRDQLLEELEDLVTNPIESDDLTVTDYEDLKNKKKVRWHRTLYDKVARIGQDFRIDPNQLDVIRKELFLE